MEKNLGKKTSMGLDENVAGALCYVLGFITGIIFFVMEKDSKFVKFHAVQSIATFLPLMILGWIISSLFWTFTMMWLVGILSTLLFVIELVLWIILILKAYQGEMYKLPIVGDIAEKQAQQ